MKKNLKFIVKSIIFSLLIIVVFVPSVYCKEYTNSYSKDEAQIAFSAKSNKTMLRPGDEFIVTYSLDKLPSNGYGVASVSAKIYYDSSKIEFIESTEGEVGKLFLMSGNAEDIDGKGDEFDSSRYVVFSGASGGADAVTKIGVLFTAKFKVKEGASGKITMYQPSKIGLNSAGVVIDSEGRPRTDKNPTPLYLDTNLNKLYISNSETIKGDITRDGKVDMEDVYTAVKRLARGTLSDEDKLIIEVTNDGRVDMEDIYKLLKFVAGKITML